MSTAVIEDVAPAVVGYTTALVAYPLFQNYPRAMLCGTLVFIVSLLLHVWTLTALYSIFFPALFTALGTLTGWLTFYMMYHNGDGIKLRLTKFKWDPIHVARAIALAATIGLGLLYVLFEGGGSTTYYIFYVILVFVGGLVIWLYHRLRTQLVREEYVWLATVVIYLAVLLVVGIMRIVTLDPFWTYIAFIIVAGIALAIMAALYHWRTSQDGSYGAVKPTSTSAPIATTVYDSASDSI